MTVQPLGLREAKEIDSAIAAMTAERPEALFLITDGLTRRHTQQEEGYPLVHTSPVGTTHGEERHPMPLLNLSLRHGQSLEEARSRLETAVDKVMSQFGAFVRQVAWSADHTWVRLEGIGFWIELWVDALDVHATGDIPLLGALLGSPVAKGLTQILQQTFRKPLT